ncbi:Uma2 family endonuclease [Oribacterium sp. WCC10]|uniref:Uma2 family endonuclease n=1 Tax=Oribacterium sp. WCC10 TaxID=1855343 RepID=UPI0008E64937|nr:Uma2 family endonuclease [Oribacterium sp. WCC10]SFG44611.1 Endonuclease, Uma2 family (restriction endonuclease fold) [Oribacterium sp. WCC10]
MTIEEMKKKKTEKGYTNEMLSKLSGVPLGTVQKIMSGETTAPRKLTIDALSKVLGDGLVDYTKVTYPESGMVSETAVAYSAEGGKKRYTIDDYYAIPDDRRVELIDGVIYDMGAPSLTHQRILGDLFVLFRECASKHNMPCEVYLSPCDVRLDKDNYTMVQPDLLVICGEYDENGIRYEGAPEMVVEILSPSSRSKDMVLKLYKYQNAGVKEYWIIDSKHRTVYVHEFMDEDYAPKQYDFDAEIPVGISGGKCSIDFSKVRA